VDKIESQNPDIIFLDIQMPGKTGFDLLLTWKKLHMLSSQLLMMNMR
jgi:YesN/AraC family two-component response regulator